MSILRIRENFSPSFHALSSIDNFESKWKSILTEKFQDTIEYKHRCEKLSNDVCCFEIRNTQDSFQIETSYLIGIDHLSEGIQIMVEPKFSYNEKDYSIDFYKILFESLPFVKSTETISDLYFVDFEAQTIEIEQKDDFLTPILVIQYLNILKRICQNGLQKGYYKIDENLDGKVKGKILIKETLKKNHLKANYSKTYCNYQEYGINTIENQLLKYAFQFCMNYLNQFKQLDLFQNLESTTGMIRSTIQKIDVNHTFNKTLYVKKNPLFPLYDQAIKLANTILKRNAFNITNTTTNKVNTYPYWINMSKLFELHVLKLLRESLKEGVIYQNTFGGRIPDIVINTEQIKAVIDVKYKAYDNTSIEINDIRQVAAYSRMKTIFKTLNLSNKDVLDAIIIYPKVGSQNKALDPLTLQTKEELKEYYNIYKLEVSIPIIKNDSTQ
ncbi:5-methylcytosine restriction system specificity protein McrC [Myroides marinus]|uniref:5-methylcytosine restriction system specificity protein McrC n=1 Tax=Myroides marinus TaxID=703342 RepID=UPI00257490DE|nr:hypothetical protein [Myroides marinus]MDM1376698.1 hypothetical protein [Myroides marinus]